MKKSIVSIAACKEYQLDLVRQAVEACLAPLGGMRRFVHPGMTVLLKPNLLTSAKPELAITTHPAVVQAVAEQVIQAGGQAWIGDSPNSSSRDDTSLWQSTGMARVAGESGAKLVSFSGSIWKHLNGYDYILAGPVSQADLIIDLPKFKTHTLTLYTGAIKNLLGCVPGKRKTAMHIHAPGITDFSRMLVDLLELVHPSLSIMDAVVGLDGNGPGLSGKPHDCGFLAASADTVALDSVCSQAMGFRPGKVIHIAIAAKRGLGKGDPAAIEIAGDPVVLNFGRMKLPGPWLQINVPSWLSAPLASQLDLRPRVDPLLCTGCDTCSAVCPTDVITPGKPPVFDLSKCIGCMCCSEACPAGAIAPRRTLISKLIGLG